MTSAMVLDKKEEKMDDVWPSCFSKSNAGTLKLKNSAKRTARFFVFPFTTTIYEPAIVF
jgi:hypothetical protein